MYKLTHLPDIVLLDKPCGSVPEMHHGQSAPFLGWLLCPGQSTDAQRFQQNVCILKMARIVGNMHQAHTHCYRGLLKNGKLGVQMQRKTGNVACVKI